MSLFFNISLFTENVPSRVPSPSENTSLLTEDALLWTKKDSSMRQKCCFLLK
jgi:hypothetical protein